MNLYFLKSVALLMWGTYLSYTLTPVYAAPPAFSKRALHLKPCRAHVPRCMVREVPKAELRLSNLRRATSIAAICLLSPGVQPAAARQLFLHQYTIHF